jgi:threonyl-tRNA synthetase
VSATIRLTDGREVETSSEEAREVFRHSTAHVMAQAVCELFPGTRYAIGPSIADGFYYDFDVGRPFTPEDLEAIEEKMRAIIAADQPFVREELSRDEALQRFSDQPFKREIIEGVDEAEGAGSGAITVFRNDGWADLCRGPHIERTGRVPAFKLLRVAGAYWRGDERNPMLQRIYGTAWESKEALDAYLTRLEEAARRDHRKLGRELDLFSFPEELGGGLLVWHPKGGALRKELEDFARAINLSHGYVPVFTPHIARGELWETSGHLRQYAENMYPPMELEGHNYYAKPMNCPFHVLVYKSKIRSYRDLPIRLFELGTVYRNERAGVLHGLLRIRGFTQDDSHIFCRRDQLVDEIIGVMELTVEIHRALGFGEPKIELSTKPGKAIGDESMWAEATEALRSALDKWKKPYTVAEGEGAFYGPKIDFHFADAIGRYWQLTTIQVDFALPEAFDLHYAAGQENVLERPVMIHRAIFGSIERVTGVLIEHYAGAFPAWLAPVQAIICPVADRHNDHCEHVAAGMRAKGIRVEVDNRREKLGHKIRDAKLQKAPYILVIGDADLEANTAGVNPRDGEQERGVPVAEFTDRLLAEIASRAKR